MIKQSGIQINYDDFADLTLGFDNDKHGNLSHTTQHYQLGARLADEYL